MRTNGIEDVHGEA